MICCSDIICPFTRATVAMLDGGWVASHIGG